MAHRRAGKTVALVNQLIRAGLTRPLAASSATALSYVGPSFDQVKDLCRGYLKHYAGGYAWRSVSRGGVDGGFPERGDRCAYGGGQAYERIRRIYSTAPFWMTYPLLNRVFERLSLRPTLADEHSRGRVSQGPATATIIFTPSNSEDDAAWDVFDIKLQTPERRVGAGATSFSADMPADEYAREMLNAFDAPVEGGVYTGRSTLFRLNAGSPRSRSSTTLITGWDIGIHDFTCIWIFQIAGKEISCSRLR